jgi:hypothetical protein
LDRAAMANSRYRDQLESRYGSSAQITSLRNLAEAYDLALKFCLALTASETGFIDLLNEGHVDMDVVAVKGFAPPDPEFYERFKRTPVRPRERLLGTPRIGDTAVSARWKAEFRKPGATSRRGRGRCARGQIRAAVNRGSSN